jgi:protein ImuA
MASEAVHALRERVAALSGRRVAACVEAGADALSGCLRPGETHEMFAATQADAAAALAFALCAARMTAGAGLSALVAPEFLGREAGWPHAPGLAELGLSPRETLLVSLKDSAAVLRAGADLARTRGLGAAVVALWGETPLMDLTASRKLTLAARDSGVALMLVRIAALPRPSAAATRWSIAAAPSRPLPGNAPGVPRFRAHLLRRRGGVEGQEWLVEWNRELGSFDIIDDAGSAAPGIRPRDDARPALSGGVAAFPAHGTAAPRPGADTDWRHAG